MPEPSFPEILQAEAYHNGRFVLIRNNKTEKVVEVTKQHPTVTEPICEVPDFPAFLDAIAEAIRDSGIIVTLGDSRTANFCNWPRILAITNLRRRCDIVVLNLADWACCSEDHVGITEYFFSYLRRCGAKYVSIILFGELIDLAQKLSYYTEYMDNLRVQAGAVCQFQHSPTGARRQRVQDAGVFRLFGSLLLRINEPKVPATVRRVQITASG